MTSDEGDRPEFEGQVVFKGDFEGGSGPGRLSSFARDVVNFWTDPNLWGRIVIVIFGVVVTWWISTHVPDRWYEFVWFLGGGYSFRAAEVFPEVNINNE